MLNDSKTGYCLDAEVDARQIYAEDPEYTTVGLVLTMMRRSGYLGQFYNVVCDNYYSSKRLVLRLLEEDTFFMGMLQNIFFFTVQGKTTVLNVFRNNEKRQRCASGHDQQKVRTCQKSEKGRVFHASCRYKSLSTWLSRNIL